MKTLLKQTYRKLSGASFRFLETPAHYFSPIPNVTELDPSVYDKIFEARGVDWNVKAQKRYLNKAFPKYAQEYTPTPNTGLSLVDAIVLYCVIREKKPKKMVEIGSGESTLISLQALERNAKEGRDYSFTAIEPYPSNKVKNISEERFRLLQKKLQEVSLEEFKDADLVFIDSSHVCKIDSDVNREILEIVPSLKKGCLVHWHDIVMPGNYWREWMEHGNMFFNESYVVHAFLLYNNAFRILWASRYMQLHHKDLLRRQFPYLEDAHRLSSLWIERIR
jgi:predicted O-methyltransferase YrrM